VTHIDRLQADDHRLVQACLNQIGRALIGLGLDVEFSVDLGEWVDTIRSAPKNGVVNPAFDPRHSDLSPSNAFWIRLYEIETERTVACIANRMFETADFLDLWRTQRLWYSRGPRQVIELAVPSDMPRIAGRVGHHGGLWIHPDWRKHGLSGYLTKLTRCASLRQFEVDWHCGSVFAAIAEKGLPTAPQTGYGYPHMVLAIDGWFPVTNRHERLYLPWISRPEMLDQLGRELERLVADRNQQAIRFAAVP
jgi:hypothetical protein